MVILLAALIALPARAACIVSQTHAPDGVEFDIQMDGSCPSVSIIADRPGVLRAWQEHDGFSSRLRGDQVVPHPWAGSALGWRVSAPVLAGKDRMIARLAWTDDAVGPPRVDVRLDGGAPQSARGGTAISTWTFVAAEHPEWGFTDPRFGSMEKTTTWTFGEDGEAGWLDAPRADGGGAWWPGGAGSAVTAVVESPASAQGEVLLPPGGLTIRAIGPVPTLATSGDVDVSRPSDDPAVVAVVAAPAGGVFRWRVVSVGGVGVIADDVGFVAGTDTHFRVASLHEPALPMSLRGERDIGRILRTLWEAVRAPPRGLGGDVGHPRPLNRAWHSGWLTDGERALVLLRLLGQARIGARWVLTGAHPDAETFVGYDHLLIAAQLPKSNQVIWLDPSCAGCGLGEIDPALSGRPAVGGAGRSPVLPGTLEVSVAFVQSDLGEPVVRTTVVAAGDGARWVRAQMKGEAWETVPAGRLDDLAQVFGAVTPVQVSVTAWSGEAVSLTFDSASAPRPVDLPQFGG